eukprot:CAMPEP_0205830146 /NCGR_PEP_ID=MMETSP0206-20130828/40207_1 /ASSEMBLY_ACC=CAM_ASM_000279 /TAXON_ID=36767 /ORGANISM="Euplotes focardii, Strain TN1" /LENGTH=105 /DNA_ID=CAMNT_0053133521 /DNA_START=30 /DNA_END=344 /DNA_ORIENTATION=+
MADSREDNLGLAFGMTAGAGMATTLGALMSFVVKLENTSILAIGLGISAGVMIFVSFVEILATKAIEGLADSTEVSDGYEGLVAYVMFFVGALFCWILDLLVHRL